MKIFTLNTWQFPRSKDKKYRLKKLITFLKKEDFDIINLQELWFSKDRNEVIRELKGYYPFHSNTWILNKSGLLSLSRHKMFDKKIEFFEFSKDHSWEERLGNKGYISFKVKKDKKVVQIVNTHLYDIDGPNSLAINRRDLERIQFEFKNQKNLIITGDFNLKKKEVDKISLMPYTSNEKTFVQENKYVDEDLNDKLDYIFYKGFKRGISTLVKKGFSDHFGLICELK